MRHALNQDPRVPPGFESGRADRFADISVGNKVIGSGLDENRRGQECPRGTFLHYRNKGFTLLALGIFVIAVVAFIDAMSLVALTMLESSEKEFAEREVESRIQEIAGWFPVFMR